MKLPGKFVESATGLWPNAHKRFEEMGALAVTGQLDGARMSELNDHIVVCVRCRRFVESAAQVSVRAMPLLADSRASAADIVPPNGMRSRVLSRLVREVGDLKAPAVVPPGRPRNVCAEDFCERERNDGRSLSRARAAAHWVKWLPVSVAVCLMLWAVGFEFGKRAAVRPNGRRVVQDELAAQRSAPEANSEQIIELQRQKAVLQSELARMKGQLSSADDQQKVLSAQLATAKSNLAEYTARTQIALEKSSAESNQASSQITALQGRVDGLTQQLAEVALQLAVQKKETGDTQSKLEVTETQLEKALDLNSAKGEFASVLGARNLHIVDVYDADSSGRRQRPFGRVFYIEGKSLVFYAYDLSDPVRFNANVVFHVWGGKAGVKDVTHSLGILHKDDAGDSRWSLTFDDPKVLATINSVFVTVETASKHDEGPHGKKILYAYFGSQPNHP